MFRRNIFESSTDRRNSESTSTSGSDTRRFDFINLLVILLVSDTYQSDSKSSDLKPRILGIEISGFQIEKNLLSVFSSEERGRSSEGILMDG